MKLLYFLSVLIFASSYAGQILTKGADYQSEWQDPESSKSIAYSLFALKTPEKVDQNRHKIYKGTLTIDDSTYQITILRIGDKGETIQSIAIEETGRWKYATSVADGPVRRALARIFKDLFLTLDLTVAP